MKPGLVSGWITAWIVLVLGLAGAETESIYEEARMLVTESAVPVEEGRTDVEFGLVYSYAKSGKRGMWDNNWARSRRRSFRMHEWGLQVRYGIYEETELALSTGWVEMHDRKMPPKSEQFGYPDINSRGFGMDDLRVTVKRRLVNDEGSSLAYIPGLTIPSGRQTNLSRGRFGPGQNYWSFDQRIALTQEFEDFILNSDIGYSLPFGRTRRTYKREFGRYTGWNKRTDKFKSPGERGVLDFNAGVAYREGPFRPLAELNYSYRFICSHGNGSDQLHAAVGGVYEVDENARLKMGYQFPLAGRNVARTHRFHLSLAHLF